MIVARPQTEDGFVMIALDLFSAVMSAGLSGYAQIVLAEVMLQWAGPGKKRKVYLHGSEIAEATGLDRNNARRAIRELTDAGIIRPDGEGFTFNKDYESWMPKSGPIADRLGGRMALWIGGSIERHGAPANHRRKSKSGESTQTQTTDGDESTQTHKTTVCESTQTHNSPGCESTQTQRRSPPPHPPIEEPARQKNLELRKEDGRGESAPAPIRVSPIPDDPVSKQCLQLALDRWGACNGDSVIGDLLRTFTPKVVRYAMDRMWDKHGDRLNPAYIRSICRGVDEDGIPVKPGENNGKTAVQQRPEDTVAVLRRPDIPRNAETEATHQMWDRFEEQQRRAAR